MNYPNSITILKNSYTPNDEIFVSMKYCTKVVTENKILDLIKGLKSRYPA